MGFLGFGDYNKAGPGVPKNAPKKKAFFRFWDVYLPRFWKLCGLNFIYLICCLPIVTIGPATAGFTYVLRKYSSEKYTDLSDFFRIFKRDFKKSFIMGIIDVLLVFIAGFSLYFYYFNARQGSKFFGVIFVITLSMTFLLIMMHFYIYLMIVLLDLKLTKIIKNSLLLTYAGFKTNIITFLIVTLSGGLIAYLFMSTTPIVWPFLGVFIAFVPLSFWGFVICFNTFPVIRKFVIDPYYEERGEKNPEDAEMDTSEEAVFVDRGGEEAPINPKPKKKGKRIR